MIDTLEQNQICKVTFTSSKYQKYVINLTMVSLGNKSALNPNSQTVMEETNTSIIV